MNKQTTLQRNISADFRAETEEGGRKFSLSFSSEEPVDRAWGAEILDHAEGAVDMSRLQDGCTVLFNHNPDKILGKVTSAKIEKSRGVAEIEFDDDEFAEIVRKKVASGTLRGVSVGYQVDDWEEVRQGKTSKDGRFTGPCEIARKWTPLEISIVSVPADPTVGVGRAMHMDPQPSMVEYERQLQINENYSFLGGKAK